MISKFIFKLFLILLTVTVVNSYSISTEQENEYHDCDFDSIRKLWTMMGSKELENLTDNEIVEMIEMLRTGQPPSPITWREYFTDFWSVFLQGAKIGAILSIPCYLIKKYFGYRPIIIVY